MDKSNTLLPLINLSLINARMRQDEGQRSGVGGSDGLGGAVVDQTLSVFEANRGVVDGHSLVL